MTTIVATCGTCTWRVLNSPRVAIGPTGNDGEVDVQGLAKEHHESRGHVVVIANADTGQLTHLPPESEPGWDQGQSQPPDEPKR